MLVREYHTQLVDHKIPQKDIQRVEVPVREDDFKLSSLRLTPKYTRPQLLSILALRMPWTATLPGCRRCPAPHSLALALQIANWLPRLFLQRSKLSQ